MKWKKKKSIIKTKNANSSKSIIFNDVEYTDHVVSVHASSKHYSEVAGSLETKMHQTYLLIYHVFSFKV